MRLSTSLRQKLPVLFYSLRGRLLLLSAGLLVSVAGLIAINSNRLLSVAIGQHTRQQAEQVAALLNFSLTPYSTNGEVQEMADFLHELVSVNSQGLTFIGLYTLSGEPIMVVGEAPVNWQPAKGTEQGFEILDNSVMVSRPMLLEQNRIGRMSFQLSTRLLNTTREALLRQTLFISASALGIALLLLTIIGFWITRRISPLALASKAIIANQPMPQLDESGRDEITLMSRALNAMDKAIRHRISELEEAAHEYRGLLDHAALGIARIELDGSIGICNSRWDTTLTGASHTASRLVYQSYPWLGALLDELRDGTPGDEINTTVTSESGVGIRRYFRVGASVFRSRDGIPRYYICMVRDVTVETTAAIAQQASSALYRTIAETAQEGMSLVDNDGNIRYANGRLAHMFGNGTVDTLLGRSLPQLLGLPGSGAEQLMALDGKDIQTTGKSSQPLWLLCAFNPLPPDATRGYDGLLCMMIDITTRKEAELQLATYNEKLESEVASRTARLQELNKELELFSYSISHDLRAPLRAIAGFSSILQETEQQLLSEDGRQMLGRIIAGANRMNAQLDGMLQLSRLTRSEIRTQQIDLSDMAHSLIDELQASTGTHASIHIGEGLFARTDPLLIRAALENLLSNALKYSSKVAVPRVEFDMTWHKGKHVFYVRDNGAGFEQEHAAKLFGLFQRLHSSAEFEGTGVGLASVKRILTRLGGDVWAESSPGSGATFYFSLPE